MGKRDYSPFGADAKRAVDSGLTAAEWYHTEVPRSPTAHREAETAKAHRG